MWLVDFFDRKTGRFSARPGELFPDGASAERHVVAVRATGTDDIIRVMPPYDASIDDLQGFTLPVQPFPPSPWPPASPHG
jgi:hypothetical protein